MPHSYTEFTDARLSPRSVLVHLAVGNADHFAELPLGQPKHGAKFTDTGPDMSVDRGRLSKN